ncbi:MAG: hypothetical protein Kow0069_04740 [Promethearchaeota archaeon]
MSIKIKTPNADEVFERWKASTPADVLKKHWAVKKAAFDRAQVTSAEYVKNVVKAAVFFFQASARVAPAAQSRGKSERVDARRVGRVVFFDFGSSEVDKAQWKFEELVPHYKTLASHDCPACRGSGASRCETCGGKSNVTCKRCDGSGQVQCQPCVGKGDVPVDLTVIDAAGNKRKEKKSHRCTDCFGAGKVTCYECHGIGSVACPRCKGEGQVACKECGGTGTYFTYKVLPVPFKRVSSNERFFFPSMKLGRVEQELGADLAAILEEGRVAGIALKSADELAQGVVEPNLGFFDKGVKRAMASCVKAAKDVEKDPDKSLRLPIHVFPLMILECATRKGKAFQIYAIGSDRGFFTRGTL